MAGYDGYTAFNLTARQQWLGIENAPQTFSFTFQTRVLKRNYIIKTRPLRENKFTPARSGRVGIGINIYSDRNGYFGQTGVSMSYAYHIAFTNSQLSFGLAGALSQMKINMDGLIFRNDDPLKGQLIAPVYVPDINIGMFYMNRNFYGGISSAELFQSYIKFGNPNLSDYQMVRHYYLITGYKYSPGVYYTYEPTLLIKTTNELKPQADISLKVTYRNDYWGGVSYRTGNTFIIFMGIRLNRVYVGYAFDYGFSPIQIGTLGTHELNISLKFGDSARRYKWLNRF